MNIFDNKTIDQTSFSWLNLLGMSKNVFPDIPQYATAPTYKMGAIYYDTTLNKLRVGGATAWETITSL